MRIALDMMGGDFAPKAAAGGIRQFLDNSSFNGSLLLLGDAELINAELEASGIQHSSIQVVPCTEVITYHEHPVKALKAKPDSSIAKGFGMLATGKADAFISAGNTGAMLVGSMFSLKLCTGLLRPTIATIIPRENNATGLLLDVGINADCKPENLNQFAIMGTAYARELLGIDNPTTGLLNIGEEEGKGNMLAQTTYNLLKSNSQVNFAGNVEGRDILEPKADVIVCDGFTGNIILKLLESIYPITKRQNIQHPYFDRFHFEQYGGTPVLGVEKPVIIGHGVSGEEAFANMLKLAVQMIDTNFIETMAAAIAAEPSVLPQA